MVGGSAARTLDYLWVLVDASAWALFSALVTDICVKFKQGGRRGSGQHASLVLRWSPRTAWRSWCEERHDTPTSYVQTEVVVVVLHKKGA